MSTRRGEAAGQWQLNASRQRRKFTTYERDADGGDEAMMRRYSAWWARFSQPDPYDGSYDLTDPQSLNRYSYTQNDPVNFTDPTGLDDVPRLEEFINVIGSLIGLLGGGSGKHDSETQHYMLADVLLGSPQNPVPTPTRFETCAKEAGVAGTGFNEDAANLVLRISAAEGTAPNLLAYTWGRESSFRMDAEPNTNGTTNTGRWDYGPFQINAYWIGRAIAIGQVSADGIDIGGALGGHGVRAGQPFAGDPYENGRLAARYLNSFGTGAKAAGLYTGGTRVKERSRGFNEWGPKFQAFFDCFRR